jgi:hypothetical protein
MATTDIVCVVCEMVSVASDIIQVLADGYWIALGRLMFAINPAASGADLQGKRGRVEDVLSTDLARLRS